MAVIPFSRASRFNGCNCVWWAENRRSTSAFLTSWC
uniref:Uncharacterized protein n=1 Tax=Anguilla anguilla TaxID=7936 RepID=A0A0E9Q8J0_ANGAN